ncbi:hypothetical protein ACS37W_004316, partial [Providencia stuartii]
LTAWVIAIVGFIAFGIHLPDAIALLVPNKRRDVPQGVNHTADIAFIGIFPMPRRPIGQGLHGRKGKILVPIVASGLVLIDRESVKKLCHSEPRLTFSFTGQAYFLIFDKVFYQHELGGDDGSYKKLPIQLIFHRNHKKSKRPDLDILGVG